MGFFYPATKKGEITLLFQKMITRDHIKNSLWVLNLCLCVCVPVYMCVHMSVLRYYVITLR